MAFSGTILPNVAPIQAGGPIVSASNNIFQNQINRAQAQYAPYQAYANALLASQQAKWLPYQYQMQALPMMLLGAKDNPALQNQILQMMQNPGSNLGPNLNIPPPSTGNGLLSMLVNKLTGNSSNQNPMQSGPLSGSSSQSGNLLNPSANGSSASNASSSQSDSNGSPLVPATQGTAAGLTGAMTAPYVQSPYKPGSLIPDPNNPKHVISVPTVKTEAAAQTQLLGEQRAIPQIQRLATEWAPFMDAKGLGDLWKSRVGSFFGSSIGENNMSSLGLKPDPKLVSQYATANSTLKTAPEALVKAYGLNATNETLDRLEDAIKPIWGESAGSYQQRILETLRQIKSEQEGATKHALEGGFSTAPSENVPQNVPQQTPSKGTSYSVWPQGKSPINEEKLEGQEPPKGTVWMVTPKGMQVPVANENVEYAKKTYNFRGVND